MQFEQNGRDSKLADKKDNRCGGYIETGQRQQHFAGYQRDQRFRNLIEAGGPCCSMVGAFFASRSWRPIKPNEGGRDRGNQYREHDAS